VLVGQQQQWECWLSADCKQYVTVKITFQCCSVQTNVVQLLLVVVKCVKCVWGRFVVLISHCVTICTVDS